MKLVHPVSLMVLFLGVFAQAATFNERCPDIVSCANVVADMLGQKYVFDPVDVKGKTQGTSNLELTKENAEILFTNMLNSQGFTRVPLVAPNTFQIMRQRDARDSAIPLVSCDQNTPPNLPAHWDLISMKYKATHPEVVEDIARLSRSFMPANSRIIPSEIAGVLFITDSAPNLKKLYELIREQDQKPSPQMLRQKEEERKAWLKKRTSTTSSKE